MGITAKELAEKLGLSATAVSMALNGKPGVSRETRDMVISEAEKCGYDFTKLSLRKNKGGEICYITYMTRHALFSYTPIFSELLDGIEQTLRQEGVRLRTIKVREGYDDVEKVIDDLKVSGCIGLIVLATEMSAEAAKKFVNVSLPVVLLDSSFNDVNLSSVLINNEQGAYLATSYLISRIGSQPGHLKSSYPIMNFAERENGFKKAVRHHGMSFGKTITHELSPTIEGAFSDMLEIIDQGDNLARGYFADNDLIAIGAIKALKLRGYKLPEDIAIIGFDNISEGRIIEPALTTVDIPRHYIGQAAARQLLFQIQNPVPRTVRTEVSTDLKIRSSV